jgi:hypothetical protein
MSQEIEDHAQSWPRPLIAEGRAEALSRWWLASKSAAVEAGLPAFPRHAMTQSLRTTLFEARRARWVVRGLEAAEEALSAQEKGLRQAPAARVAAGHRRISRLLVLSQEAAPRFYREVEKLCQRHASRLDAIVLECDEGELGAATFGSGRVARALLLDHKEAVVQFLGTLEL